MGKDKGGIMTQEEKEALLGEAIGMLMKVYHMSGMDMKLTDKDLDRIESIVDTYMGD